MTMLIVLLDACVLYPAPLRDLLMHLTLADLFQAKWSADIHKEWMRNVLANRPDLTLAQLKRTQKLMDENVRDCLVHGYKKLIPYLSLPDENDRHVLAAAIQSSAQTLLTYNLKDFPTKITKKYGIKAMHPDVFLYHLLQGYPERFCAAVKRLRLSLKHPPMCEKKYLEVLAQQRLPKTVSVLQNYTQFI